MSFNYRVAIAVHAATPPLGRAGTIVAVTGGGFHDTPALACFFGASQACATFVTGDEVRCVTANNLEDRGEYPLTVSNNGVDREPREEEGATGAVVFTCVPWPEVDGVDPPTLTWHEGATVTVRGCHFANIF